MVSPDDEVVFYCHGKYCPVSAYSSAKAIVWGWKRVYYFADGFPWLAGRRLSAGERVTAF